MVRIPTVTSDIPRDLRLFVDRVRESLDTRGRNYLLSSSNLNSALRGVRFDGVNLDGSTGGGAGGLDPNTYEYPSAPTGLTATGGFASVTLEWDEPAYVGHLLTEVFGINEVTQGVDPGLGNAVLLGTTTGRYFVDYIGNNLTRYYWVRFVNINNQRGPFNAVGGTVATTATDPTVLLDVLDGAITETQLFADLGARIDLIDAPTTGLVDRFDSLDDSIFGTDGLDSRIVTVEDTLFDSVSGVVQEVDALRIEVDGPDSLLGGQKSITTIRNDLYDASTGVVDLFNGLEVVYTQPNGAVNTLTGVESIVTTSITDISNEVYNAADGVVSKTTELRLRLDDPDGDGSNNSIENISVDLYDAAGQVAVTTNQLTAVFGGAGATLQTQSLIDATNNGGLVAQYSVKIDSDGYVSGFGLSSEPVEDGTPFSDFIIRADRFSIASPTTPDTGYETDATIPFFVTTTSQTINGEVVPAGTYIKTAYIQNGTITNSLFADGTIDGSKIQNSTITNSNILGGTIENDRIKTGDIQADRLVINAQRTQAEGMTFSLDASNDRQVVTFRAGALVRFYDAADGLSVATYTGAEGSKQNFAKLSSGQTRYILFDKNDANVTRVSAGNYTFSRLPSTKSYNLARDRDRSILATFSEGDDQIFSTSAPSSGIKSSNWNNTSKIGFNISTDPYNGGAGVIEGNAIRLYNINGDEIFNINGNLKSGTGVDTGAGVGQITYGALTGTIKDGEVYEFPQPYSSPPEIIFGAGGITSDSGLSGQVAVLFEAKKPTGLSTNELTHGFTARLKLVELAGSPSDEVDSTAATPLAHDREVIKSNATEAFDDKYEFEIDVSVTNQQTDNPEPFDYDPGIVTVNLYTYDASASTWTEQTSVNIFGGAGSGATLSNRRQTITVDGLNSSSDRFGVAITYDKYGSSSVTGLTVRYTSAAVPSSVSATPAGAPAVPFIVLGSG